MVHDSIPQPCFLLAIFSCIILCSSSSSPTSQNHSTPTVYQILPQFGLPTGLLPDSVKSYTLHQDGNFTVHLANSCYIQFDYLVYYKQTVTGKLRMGSIADLRGIQVKRFFLWLDVSNISVDSPSSDSIYFQVGMINKKLDVGQFENVHSCQDKALISRIQFYTSLSGKKFGFLFVCLVLVFFFVVLIDDNGTFGG